MRSEEGSWWALSPSSSEGRQVGQGLLLLVAGLVSLNGVGWFFVGPSLATFEQDTGIELVKFVSAYPQAARLLALQARNTAILLIGIGLLGAAATGTGRSGRTVWRRLTGWAFALTLAGVGLSELAAGAVFGIAYLSLGALALVGQWLALREPSS